MLALGAEVEGLRRIGDPAQSVGIFSFVIDGIHPSDLGMLLDQQGIAVRTGHHCTQPLMDKYGIPGTIRASFAVYNTYEEIDVLTDSVKRAVKMLRA